MSRHTFRAEVFAGGGPHGMVEVVPSVIDWSGLFLLLTDSVVRATQGMVASGDSSVLGIVLALVGLVGLASGGSAESIASLTEKVKRLAQGEDVEFATDRDGELGALTAALDDLTTERHRSDQERELERYRTYTDDILNAIDDVFYVLDTDGQVTRWNEALADETGYTDEEISEMHALDFFPEAVHERVSNAIATVYETGSKRIEAPLLSKSGELVPCEFRAASVANPDGTTVLVGIGRDITDQKRRQEELAERERKLSTLMDNIPGMVFTAKNELDWPFEFVSTGCRDVTGYEPEALETGEVNWGQDVLVTNNDELWEIVQEALENQDPYQVTYQIETAEGERRWVWEQGRGIFDENGTATALEGVVFDITRRKERQEELERTREFLSQSQHIASVGGWELDMTTDPPYEGSFTDELYRIHELPIGTEMTLERGLEYYHPDHRDRVEQAVERAIETGEQYELEAKFVTARGTERWVLTTGIPVYEDGELVKLRGALQDITKRKERELALESLQRTARELLGAETDTEVAELVVESAEESLNSSGIAVYLLDNETNRLEPAAYTSRFETLCGGPQSVSINQNDSVLWDSFVAGTEATIEDEEEDESSVFGSDVESGVVVPIDEYGVFVLAVPDSPVTTDSRWIIDTLVATAEAALERLENETTLRARESELTTQNRQLRRQIQVNTIIRSIHQSLIGAQTPGEIQQSVCDRLIEGDDITFAWIGTLDANGTTLEAQTWAGTGQGYLDDSTFTVAESTEPAVITAHTREPTVIENVVGGLGDEQWRRQALLRDFHSVLSVPLSFDDRFVGVLTVYADEPETFSELEETVFAELGESIANSVITTNTRQALYADTQVELSLKLACDSFFRRIAEEADCQVEYQGLAADDGETSRLFITTSGADPETVRTVLDNRVAVTTARLITHHDDECLFEVVLTEETVPTRLIRHGGNPRSIRTVGDGLEVIVDIPTTTDVREFVEMLEAEYATVELLGRQTIERSAQTDEEYREFLLDDLTERQLEVLRTAYYAGFFEWPRESTGEDIASMLDVTQPTVNRHLRLAQQRLLERLFDAAITEED